MEATLLTYEKHLFIQFDHLIIDGKIVIKNIHNKIIYKHNINNKNFIMIELKEKLSQLTIEILDNENQNKIIKII